MIKKICSKCGTENTDLALFCESCGNPLAVTRENISNPSNICPQCGSSLRTGAHFCPECGFKLQLV